MTLLHEICLQPIGIVKSPVAQGVDEDWGKVHAKIVVDEQYAAGLKGLGKFSHVLVVFYMHESSFQPGDDLVRRPRGRDDMPNIGIFSQRAKHRPNPIGITAVKVVSLDGNTLEVKGLDAINGSPVLDIKPYFPVFDRIEDAKTPSWVDVLMDGYF